MNILYGNNQPKKRLYENFLDDINPKIVREIPEDERLPEDLPPDDADELAEGYMLKESPESDKEIEQIYRDMNQVLGNQKQMMGALKNINDYVNDSKTSMRSKYGEELEESPYLDYLADDEVKEENLTEAKTADPSALGAELEDIQQDLEDFGPEGFYGVKFSNFLKEFPVFGKEVILSWIKEMDIRSPEEMEDTDTLEDDWAAGELIIPEDWPCLIDGATRMVNGRGPDKSKHWILWDKIWKTHYKAYDESLNEDTVKQNGKWVNKGKEGTHGEFDTKKEADEQRKAMFARGFKK